MAVTGLDVLTYVNAPATQPGYAELADNCAERAAVLVDHHCGVSLVLVPESVLDHAYLVTAAEMWAQKSAPNGIRTFADDLGNTGASRVARDPLVGAYPVLRPFLPGGFA